MGRYINTKAELFYGNRFWKEEVLPPGYRLGERRKEASPYFEKYGFFVPMSYNEYYSKLCGIESDQYFSSDLFYFYAYPALSRREMILPYADKNNYSLLFPGVPQPETIVKNRNGIFYSDEEKVICIEDAVERCGQARGECIIKPTLDTGCGENVDLLDTSDKATISATFARYGSDFIVQKKVVQHSLLSSLNETSLNTMRIISYRSVDGNIYIPKDKTFLRIGNKGSIRDNIGSGGGMCQVFDTGIVNDNVVRYHSMKRESAKKLWGIENFRIPSFVEAIDLVKSLHNHLPYFDLVGWDIGIGENGAPFFVEYNLPPEVGVTQQGCGPFFGEFIDEVMERISCVRKFDISCSVNVFRNHYDFYLQKSGEAYIHKTI